MRYPDHFHAAVSYVIRNEIGQDPKGDGGFTLDPSDRGGATKWGISLRALSASRGTKCTPEDVRDLSKEEALRIYRKDYWLPLSCHLLFSSQVATAVFDLGVLFGPGISAKNAQIACRSAGFPRTVSDGIIGPITLKALNAVSFPVWCAAYQKLFFDRILEIVQNDQTQAGYVRGWENRVANLRRL